MSMVTTAVIVISLLSSNNDQTLKTSVNVGSTKTIGWGIKRNDNHEQPDLGSKNKELLEKYDGSVSRLGYGLPMGGHLDYADSLTLSKSLEGRTKIK